MQEGLTAGHKHLMPNKVTIFAATVLAGTMLAIQVSVQFALVLRAMSYF